MSDARATEPTAERWIMRNGEHYCTAHDHGFPRGEVCHLCATDPGPAINVNSAAVTDREAQAAESEVRAASRSLRRIADELSEGTDQEKSLGVKYFAEYLKSMRLWREMHTARLQIESDERLIAQDREMAGLRGHN